MIAASPAALAATERGAVFVAEDDPAMRNLLVTVARRSGHAVVGCHDGEELLEKLRERLVAKREPPRLVVSDHRMPGQTGLAVAEIVRGWGWRVPFVLITAFPDDELLDLAARSKLAAVLSKPFSLADLTLTIDRYVPQAPAIAPCASCGALTPLHADRPRQVVFCEECEPTGRHRIAADSDGWVDLDSLYLDLGGSG